MTAGFKSVTVRIKRTPAGRYPSVAGGYAKGFLSYAVTKGADESTLLSRAVITPEDLADPDDRIPLASYQRLVRAAAELTGDPAIALHFGAETDFAEISVVGLVALACETLIEAFGEFSRFSRLVNEVECASDGPRFQLVNEAGRLWIIDNRSDPGNFPEITETGWARMICGTRLFLPEGKQIAKEVHVTHPPPTHHAEYSRVLRAPVYFSSRRNAIEIDPALIMARVKRTSRYAFGVLSRHAEALLERLSHTKTIRGQLEALLIPVLHKGVPKADELARQLGLSRPTLYRRLRDEGTAFARVLDSLRQRQALHYLSSGKVSVNETAYLVGFSDPSAFSRAFKRWTGKNPRAERAESRE